MYVQDAVTQEEADVEQAWRSSTSTVAIASQALPAGRFRAIAAVRAVSICPLGGCDVRAPIPGRVLVPLGMPP